MSTRKIDKIVLHHTACHNTFERIKEVHLRKGWRDIFYHYFISRTGEIREGRDINLRSNGRRPGAIEIAISGRLHINNILFNQDSSLKELFKKIYDKYGYLPVFGHKDFDPTICPGNLNVNFYHNFMKSLDENYAKLRERSLKYEFISESEKLEDIANKEFVLRNNLRVLQILRNEMI